jgi:hypothetical protein
MPALNVGGLYRTGRTRYPDGTLFRYEAGGAELALFLAAPSVGEVAAVRRGAAWVGVVALDGIIFVVYELTGLPPGDAPYSWQLVPAATRTLPQHPRAGERLLMPIVLVDAATGRVAAIRAVTLSPRVWRTFVTLIRAQAARPFDPAGYDRALAAVYARFTSGGSLSRRCTPSAPGTRRW